MFEIANECFHIQLNIVIIKRTRAYDYIMSYDYIMLLINKIPLSKGIQV